MAQIMREDGNRAPGQGLPSDDDEDARLLRRVEAFGVACLLRPASFAAANRLWRRKLLGLGAVHGIDVAVKLDRKDQAG